ncbi:MAG: hypothetical protein Q8N26_27200 [Myxococcales bacterium]|nr:hypothetical protein [Myxococcales bacterium]
MLYPYLPAVGFSLAYECAEATGIQGHQPGDNLLLYSDYVYDPASLRFEVPRAFGTLDYVPAGTPGPFRLNEKLIPVAQFCAANPASRLVPIAFSVAQRTILLSRPLAAPDRFIVVAQASKTCPTPSSGNAFGVGGM